MKRVPACSYSLVALQLTQQNHRLVGGARTQPPSPTVCKCAARANRCYCPKTFKRARERMKSFFVLSPRKTDRRYSLRSKL